jgi:hypothetical protein
MTSSDEEMNYESDDELGLDTVRVCTYCNKTSSDVQMWVTIPGCGELPINGNCNCFETNEHNMKHEVVSPIISRAIVEELLGNLRWSDMGARVAEKYRHLLDFPLCFRMVESWKTTSTYMTTMTYSLRNTHADKVEEFLETLNTGSSIKG